jgi:hypothetical protein
VEIQTLFFSFCTYSLISLAGSCTTLSRNIALIIYGISNCRYGSRELQYGRPDHGGWSCGVSTPLGLTDISDVSRLMAAKWMARCGINTRIIDMRGTKVFRGYVVPREEGWFG